MHIFPAPAAPVPWLRSAELLPGFVRSERERLAALQVAAFACERFGGGGRFGLDRSFGRGGSVRLIA